MRLTTSGRTFRGKATEVTILDLSTGGLLIETSVKLAVGDELEVELPRTGLKCARVVWSSGEFYGCRFDEAVAPAAVSAALLKSSSHRSPADAELTEPGGEGLGARIARLREHKGWSLDELATHIGVSRQAVWYWETGQRVPRADLFIRMADALSVSEQELLGARSSHDVDGASLEQMKNAMAALLGVSPEKLKVLVEY